MITRTNKSNSKSFADATIEQLGEDYKILLLVGSIMFIFALVPGLPTFSLAFVGLIFLGLGYMAMSSDSAEVSVSQEDEVSVDEDGSKPEVKSPEEVREEESKALDDILKQEVLELDLGYQLIKLADPAMDGDLLDRIRSMRRKIASDYGFLIPQVRIRDNLHLAPNQYQFLLKGVDLGSRHI
jgi:flagellar biosynthesis protein FlhA